MRRFMLMQKGAPDDFRSNKIENGNGCHHHWKIESANGPKSHAVCKFCGAQQEFQNSPLK